MGQWVTNHLSPARFAYQFSNDYQSTAGSSSMNFSGSFTYNITITPKEGQLYYALALKGDPNSNPRLKLANHTLFFYVEAGFLRCRIYGTNAQGYAVEIISLDPIVNTTDVSMFSVVLDLDLKQILLYKNAVSVPFSWINISNDTISQMSDINTGSFPSVFNSTSTPLVIGYALGYNQFEGIVHDESYHSKALSPTEINNIWNQVRNPNPSTLQKIIFSSDRQTSPARYRLWTMDEKGGNQSLFLSQGASLFYPRVNKSSNTSINATKLAYYWAGNGGIVVSDVDGGNPVTYLSGTTASQLEFNYTLTKVCYVKLNSSTSRYDIFIADFNPSTNTISNESLFHNEPNGNCSTPTFSPDGNKILFRMVVASGGATNYEYLMVKEISTNAINILRSGTANEDFSAFCYNKQNTKIGFSQRINHSGYFGYRYQVFVMDTDGGNLKQITGDAFDSGFSDFSSDGTKVIYNYSFTSGVQIMKADIDGRNKVNISGVYFDGYNDIDGCWYNPS